MWCQEVLSEYHLAEDVLQEALTSAFLNIVQLREPHAFRAWLRKIVFKYCDRILRQRPARFSPCSGSDSAGRELATSEISSSTAHGRHRGCRRSDITTIGWHPAQQRGGLRPRAGALLTRGSHRRPDRAERVVSRRPASACSGPPPAG